MRNYDPQQPLIFVHVPKSAGTAVRGVVESWFPGSFHYNYYDERNSKMPDLLPIGSPGLPEKSLVIYGHFNKRRGFGIEDYYPDVSQFVTILRDPFETVVSGYFFVRKKSNNWKDQSRVPTEGLEKHLVTVKPNILNHFPREMNLTNYKDILEEVFIEIGIMENLPLSLEIIAKKLGKDFDRETLNVVNVTERDEPVPDFFRDQFMEAHPLEYAVYEYAKSRLIGD